jgi:hypothetical protein
MHFEPVNSALYSPAEDFPGARLIGGKIFFFDQPGSGNHWKKPMP